MTSSQVTVCLFALFVLAWTLIVNGKAIDVQNGSQPVTDPQNPDLWPPLIFPTDKSRIVPINKTAIKILMHEDDIYNSSSSSSDSGSARSPRKTTKDEDAEEDKESASAELTSSEAADLRRTDEKIARSEEEHLKFAKSHPVEISKVPEEENNNNNNGKGVNDQVENIQEVSSKLVSELEEQFNRPEKTFIGVSIVNHNVRDHLALASVVIVISLGLSIFAVLLFWRNKLERRYGNRHRLFTDEDSVQDITL